MIDIDKISDREAQGNLFMHNLAPCKPQFQDSNLDPLAAIWPRHQDFIHLVRCGSTLIPQSSLAM